MSARPGIRRHCEEPTGTRKAPPDDRPRDEQSRIVPKLWIAGKARYYTFTGPSVSKCPRRCKYASNRKLGIAEAAHTRK